MSNLETRIRTVLDAVYDERLRQEELVSMGRIPATCASDRFDVHEKFTILSEEVGEVARAILNQSKLSTDEDYGDLRTELIQVAAVACAIVEGLED